MNPKYRACLAQKWEAHSFLPSPHGGWVVGWRKIHMIMTAQVKKDCHQKHDNMFANLRALI